MSERASTTLRMSPSEHQLLVALLQFKATAITEGQFMAAVTVISPGWSSYANKPVEELVQLLSESLVQVVR